jgi:hypothetical protein
MNNPSKERVERMPHWQKNIITLFNPELGREESMEYAYSSMLSGYNEPKTF